MQKLSLQTVLPTIKQNIRNIALAFGTNKIEIQEIEKDAISGRQYVGCHRWPINEALDFFEAHGVIKRQNGIFEIINDDFFNIDLKSLNVPIGFNIDERISLDITIMMGLYGEVYDIENRIRFFLTKKLKQKYGENFIINLTRKVQENINSEKAKKRIFITDIRNSELEFSNFSDLIDIFRNENKFILEKRNYQVLLEKMQYLNEIRTAIGHHNRLIPEETSRVKESCQVLRRILSEDLL